MSDFKVTLRHYPGDYPWPWFVIIERDWDTWYEVCMTQRGAKRWARRKIRKIGDGRKYTDYDVTDEVTS